MAPTVLLVATATQWLGIARIPRDFDKAGWSVAVLAPKGTLADHSRHVSKIGYLPDHATAPQWSYAFAATVTATAPKLVLPCDDTAFRLMHQLVIAPPDRMQPVLHLQLAKLIVDSLGDPAHFGASVDKTLISRAAEAAGVRVPRHQIVAHPDEASAFAAAHGWPVVLKRSRSTAGDGVAICANPDALKSEFARLAGGKTPRPGESGPTRLVVQAFIPGRTQYFAGTAWRGAMLCGYAVDKLEGEPKGAASVVRYFHSPELAESASRLAAAFGASGIFAPEYIVDEKTREPYLLEVNRRVTPGTHRGEFFNMSSGAALLAASEGKPPGTRARFDAGEVRTFVSFPHEWLRDPGSAYLREYPVDAPWDEPELFEAMLAMRRA
jgi:predicted ATP-grasp superfamily ATP-dependent carboligase